MSRFPTRVAHACVQVSLPVARDAMARALLHETRASTPSDTATLGSLVLLPHQVDAVKRLRAALHEMHTALLADDVGLGKTYVALAVAQEYAHVLIIAPAALLPMWRSATVRARCVHARLESVQRFSRATPPHIPRVAGTLVIIDEAHHLRTPSTRRYRAVASVVAGCDLLMLSATPVHNAVNDLRALFALALGSQANQLTDSRLARLIVRRTQHDGRPLVAERPPLHMPHHPALLDAILALPAPLPAHDGAVAGALIRLGLLRAWCSSDAALARALRQRLLRGEALRQALQAGRHPTSAELRSWLVGEHEVQLAFPELLAGHTPETGPLLDVLSAHLDAARYLLRTHERASDGDHSRVHALRTIMGSHPDLPVVAFSQYSATVRAIGRALADIAGVGVLTAQRAWVAGGPISRREALAKFAPVAQGVPPPPSHQRIRLLLTTDLLAEGVNLQDAGVVVHLDLPWTDALRQQRVGRCARMGSPHNEVVVYRFEPPPQAEAAIELVARLERKARLSARLVGESGREAVQNEERRLASGASPARSRSPADAATTIRSLLLTWIADAIVGARPALESGTPCCAVVAEHSGFVSVVALRDGTSALVGGSSQRHALGVDRLRLTTSPQRLLEMLRAITVTAHPLVGATTSWPRACRMLLRWIDRQVLSAELGDSELCASPSHVRVRNAVSGVMADLSPAQRVALRSAHARALDVIARSHGFAAERALSEWLATARDTSTAAWLSQWALWPALAACVTTAAVTPPSRGQAPHVVAAVLFEARDRRE